MAHDVDLVARMLAFDAGHAVPIASHRQVAIRPDALIVCPIAMAGEDTTIHAVAYGTLGQPPTVLCVPDPRRRDDQYRLFERLGIDIESLFSACRANGTYPQIWVSSGAAVTLLDTLADRLRYNRENVAVKRLGELLSHATERYPIAGQQALHSATGALRTHWATGQQAGEDEHLGTLLAWIDPLGDDIHAAVAKAELIPMGVKTDPNFDRDVLEPLVTAYNEARRAGEGNEVLAHQAAKIREVLAPEATRVYDGTQQAIRHLLGADLPLLPDLAELERIEADNFSNFMASRDAGYGLALRDSPKAAVYKFTAREDAAQNVRAAVDIGDRVGRARATLAGQVLNGRVGDVRRHHIGPRRTRTELDIESVQRVLRIRRRDKLHWAEDPCLKVIVTDVHRVGETTHVSVVITAEMLAVGIPANGVVLELVPSVPDWSRTGRSRGQLKIRVSATPWTHDPTRRPTAVSKGKPPADPLALIEQLR